MLKYGTDKPDLRNPLIINDFTSLFTREDVKFDIFKKIVKLWEGEGIIIKNTIEVFLTILTNGQKNKVHRD